MQKEKQLMPKLRFSGFEGEWGLKKMGEICSMTSSKRVYLEDYVSKGVPFYRGKEISELRLNKVPNDILFITRERYEEFKEKYGVPLKDDILITAVGTLGNVLRIRNDDEFYFKDGNLIWLKNIKVDSEFLEILIQWKNNDLLKTSIGSTQKALTMVELRKLKFSFPQQEEQQKIANFLSSIDTQIQTLEKKKSLLEQYKKGVMQKIFKQELKFKDEGGEKFPEWSKKKLGNLTYKVGKKNKENIQYPIYSINNQEGFRPQSEQFEGLDSNDRGYDISLYKIVHKETFAYNPARINVGSIGYSYDLKEVIVSSLYVCFKTNEELEDLYLLAYLDTDRFNKDILRYQEGGVRQYLFYDNFSHIKIPLPSNEEQIKIANFLSEIDKNIALVNTKIEHTKAYKKGLLQQMFV